MNREGPSLDDGTETEVCPLLNYQVSEVAIRGLVHRSDNRDRVFIRRHTVLYHHPERTYR